MDPSKLISIMFPKLLLVVIPPGVVSWPSYIHSVVTKFKTPDGGLSGAELILIVVLLNIENTYCPLVKPVP